jgi:hypothetical protein
MLGGVVGGAGVAAYSINAGNGIAMIGASEAGTSVGALMLCTLLGVRWQLADGRRRKGDGGKIGRELVKV